MDKITFIVWLQKARKLDEAWQLMTEQQLAYTRWKAAEQWPQGEEIAIAAKKRLFEAQGKLFKLHDEYAEQMGKAAGSALEDILMLRDLVGGCR